jgi:hypothetical protein
MGEGVSDCDARSLSWVHFSRPDQDSGRPIYFSNSLIFYAKRDRAFLVAIGILDG